MTFAVGSKFALPCSSGAHFGGQLSDANLLTYWRLDESSGDALDAGPNGYNLTQMGTVSAQTGKISGARGTYSTSNYFRYLDASWMELGDTDATMAGWIYLTSTGVYHCIHSRWTSGTTKVWRFLVTSSQRAYFGISSNGSTEDSITADTFGALSTTTWYFVAARYDATNDYIDLRVNTTDQTHIAHATGFYDAGTSNLTMGVLSDLSSYPAGLWLDEMSIWTRRLSDAELTTLYNGGSGLTY